MCLESLYEVSPKGSCADDISPTRWTIERWLEHSGSNCNHWWIKSDTLVGSGRSVVGRDQGWSTVLLQQGARGSGLSLLASVILSDCHKRTALLCSALQSRLSASPQARRCGPKRTCTETEILNTFLFFPQIVSNVVPVMKVLLTLLKDLPTPPPPLSRVQLLSSGRLYLVPTGEYLHKQVMRAFLLKTQVCFK